MNSTYFGLFAEFNTAEIKLEDCCEKYFGLGIERAKRDALAGKLPVPVYRPTRSQKSGWLISADELAKYLDRQKAIGLQHFQGAGSHSGTARSTNHAA